MARMPSTPLRMILAVIITSVVSASSLAFTYQLTRDRIMEQERLAREEALREVLPQADEFVEVEDEDTLTTAQDAAGETPVEGLFDAGNGAFGVLVAPRGYGGPMRMVIGVDRDGKVTGVSIVTQNETPGLGTKIMTEPGFLDQFAGWDASDIDGAAGGFDAISGATRSSNGVRAGVLAAGHVWAALSGEGGGAER